MHECTALRRLLSIIVYVVVHNITNMRLIHGVSIFAKTVAFVRLTGTKKVLRAASRIYTRKK